MAEVILMPRLSDTMTEGVIADWHKKVGDAVKKGDILADIETDKATMELENYVDGTLLYIGVEKGKAAKVDGVLAVVGKEGEDYKALLTGDAEKPQAASSKPQEAAARILSRFTFFSSPITASRSFTAIFSPFFAPTYNNFPSL